MEARNKGSRSLTSVSGEQFPVVDEAAAAEMAIGGGGGGVGGGRGEEGAACSVFV